MDKHHQHVFFLHQECQLHLFQSKKDSHNPDKYNSLLMLATSSQQRHKNMYVRIKQHNHAQTALQHKALLLHIMCQCITYCWWGDIESNVIPISASIFGNVQCQCVRAVKGDTHTAGCEWCLKHVTDQLP